MMFTLKLFKCVFGSHDPEWYLDEIIDEQYGKGTQWVLRCSRCHKLLRWI
jgi:hypothetical protein